MRLFNNIVMSLMFPLLGVVTAFSMFLGSVLIPSDVNPYEVVHMGIWLVVAIAYSLILLKRIWQSTDTPLTHNSKSIRSKAKRVEPTI